MRISRKTVRGTLCDVDVVAPTTTTTTLTNDGTRINKTANLLRGNKTTTTAAHCKLKRRSQPIAHISRARSRRLLTSDVQPVSALVTRQLGRIKNSAKFATPAHSAVPATRSQRRWQRRRRRTLMDLLCSSLDTRGLFLAHTRAECRPPATLIWQRQHLHAPD